MKLINGYVLVEVLKKENKSSSGLFLSPETAVNDEGIVVEIDPKVSHIVKVGDKVKFNPNVENDYEYNGKACKFLKAFDKDSPRTDIILIYV